ncbi:MAG: hypothetical protein WBZ29_03605 [Methanocella sp.]
MRYFNIVLSASLMLLFCILSVAPAMAVDDTFSASRIAPGPDGNVYAAASNVSEGNCIFVFAPDGTLAKTLDRPAVDLAFDEAGNLYVLERMSEKRSPHTIFNITRIDENGNATLLWSNVNQSDLAVVEMAVSPCGVVYFSTLYVVQTQSGQAGDSVHFWEIDAIDANGTLRVISAKNTTMPSEGFDSLAVDRNGTIYTAGVSNRINVIAPDGTTRTIGKLGSANGTFNGVFDIAIGMDGFLYVVESGNRRIQKLTTDGAFVAKWNGCGPDPFIGHISPAIDENGRVYVADLDNRRIVWFTPDYTYGTDENENMKGRGVTWGTIYAGTNYTTQLLERQFEELQNESEPTPTPGFAAFVALIGIGLGAALYCLRK